MSSANYVRLAYIPETVYGETPVAGNFKTARFTDEKLSGSAGTTESKQIRTDRMSGGQIVTGLTVGGQVSIELAREASIDDFIASAMLNTWSVVAPVVVSLELDATANTLERTTGSFITDGIKVGDFITPAGFADANNNTQLLVAEIVSATVLRIVGPKTGDTAISSQTGGTSYKRADKITIGTAPQSFSMEKTFLDLTEKAINFTGMLANQMDLNVAFGDLIGGSFAFSGNGYQTVEDSLDFLTNGRTIDAAATTPTFNGSVDMPVLASSAIGVLDETVLDIQSVGISLNNNFSPENVIGSIAPKRYSAGTAAIQVKLTAYLSDDAWAIQDKKISQDPFSIGFMVKNGGGWYGFFMPAVQVAFDDPSSSGQNAQITLDMTGTAKVGADGGSSLVIYRS